MYKAIHSTATLFTICLALLACGESEHSKINTVVSDSSVQQRFNLIERRFTPQQICEDYQLFSLIMRDLHFESVPVDSLFVDCPSTYQQFDEKIKQQVRSTRDLHTTVSLGYGLDASSYPVIQSCEPASVCKDMIGSQLMTLPSHSPRKFYAIATDIRQRGHIFEIRSISGDSLEQQLKSFRAQLKIPNASETFPYFFTDYLLKRDSLDFRSKANFTAELQEISSKLPVKMTLSYDDRQTIAPSPTVAFMNSSVEFARTYGCNQLAPGAQDLIGSCVTASGKGVFWLTEWPQLNEEFIRVLDEQLNWLDAHATPNFPLIFDLSGNQGGSPLSVAHFMCRVGGDTVREAMNSYEIVTRPWPEAFAFGARSIRSDELQILVNGDLIFRDNDWVSRYPAGPSSRTRISGFLNRAQLAGDACAARSLPQFEARQWLVTTNGQEFSATEDFLLLAAKSRGRFTSIGYSSAGGVGAPSWVVLPHTLTRVRLSPSRMFFDGLPVTEKIGIKPQVTMTEAETEPIFLQKALHALATDAWFNPRLEPTKPLFRKILSLHTEGFMALGALGTWQSPCTQSPAQDQGVKGQILHMTVNLNVMNLERKEYIDAKCTKEVGRKQASIANPFRVITGSPTSGLYLPVDRLTPLGFEPDTRIELTRPDDKANLSLIITALQHD